MTHKNMVRRLTRTGLWIALMVLTLVYLLRWKRRNAYNKSAPSA
jgi:hypothetical protein